MAPMAKNGRKRKGAEPASGPAAAPDSLLEAAFLCFEAGDMVGARRAAKKLLAGTPTPADEAAAKRLAPVLRVPVPPGAPEPPPASVTELAGLLVSRTWVPQKAYAFAALALAVFIGLVLLALSRS